MSKLTPISGFPEFLPEEQIVLQRITETIRSVFESFGFVPIETPAVERIEHLVEKGVEGKEVYVLRRLHEEEGSRAELALHFDLTVPLARYVAQHAGHLSFPFKRYQIQPVWRGERPQAGRFRQFYQCDIDVIGENSLSILYDAEIVAVVAEVFSRLNIGPFLISLNNRKVLQGLLHRAGVDDEETLKRALRAIDNMEKVPLETTKKALLDLSISENSWKELMDLFALRKPAHEMVTILASLSEEEYYAQGVEELRRIVDYLQKAKVSEEHFCIDLTIARGLDYYTGMVCETKLKNFPSLGSVCSGGRYENLTGVFTPRQYPGVGISIGLSRLLFQLLKEKIIAVGSSAIVPLLITVQEPQQLPRYLDLAARARSCGIGVEVYLEEKELKNQLKYANKRGIPWVLIASEQEWHKEQAILKEMATGRQEILSLTSFEAHLKAHLCKAK